MSDCHNEGKSLNGDYEKSLLQQLIDHLAESNRSLVKAVRRSYLYMFLSFSICIISCFFYLYQYDYGSSTTSITGEQDGNGLNIIANGGTAVNGTMGRDQRDEKNTKAERWESERDITPKDKEEIK